MDRKICLKCLDIKTFEKGEYCRYDGEELVTFTLTCECGAEIVPHFFARIFPPWGKLITNKHCPQCGRDIREPVMNYLREFKVGKRERV